MNKIVLTSSLLISLFAAINTAASANTATLNFDAGVTSCVDLCSSSGYEVYGVTSGSYFGFDGNADGSVSAEERGAISTNNGLVIGTIQDASGSHSGAPDGTENANIDAPWLYFGNTGMHYTLNATNILSDDGAGNGTLDFSGWGMAWDGVERINLGGFAWQGNADGVAVVTCAVNCDYGERYTLDYSATVPIGDPSGLGGIRYSLKLVGTISAVPVPAAVWLFASGLIGLMGFARTRKV